MTQPAGPLVRCVRIKACQAVACFTLALAGACSFAQGVVIGQVSRVHDGDTVTIAQQQGHLLIRLAAIDAPEQDQAFGDESRQQLAACAFGKPAMVEVQGLDRHGRTLGRLQVGGKDCGLEQLRTGMAWYYRRYAHEQSLERRTEYDRAERFARRRSLGLWAEPDPQEPWSYRRVNPRTTHPATPPQPR